MEGMKRLALVVLLLGAGCARPCGLGPPVGRPAVPPCDRAPLVESPERLEPDLSEVPAVGPGRLPWHFGPAPQAYRRLDRTQVQCCAAAASGIANALAREAQIAGSRSSGSTARSRTAALYRQIFICRSVEQRNRDAAKALNLFYGLAEIHAGRGLIDESRAELNKMAGFVEELQAQGIQFDADAGEVHRRQLGVDEKQIALELAAEELNLGLQQMVGLPIEEAAPIWPAADLRVVDVPVDAELAVAEGLRHRADLALLRIVYGSLNADVLDAVRAALGQFSSAPGTSPATACLLARLADRRHGETEAQARRRQIAQLLSDRQRAVAAEIRQAARTVEARVAQIALAQAQLKSLEKHRGGLIEKRGLPDGPTAFDVSETKLQIVEARRNVLGRVIAWRKAQVRLKRAQGLLAYECGYRLPVRPCDAN